MNTQFYRKQYQGFYDALNVLKESVSGSGEGEDDLKQVFARLKQLYQDEILPLSEEGEKDWQTPRWRSLQTEINRTMRLLQTDILFLQASQKSTTVDQRRKEFLQKIEKLMQFCQEILGGVMGDG